jgi:hypothetical protein
MISNVIMWRSRIHKMGDVRQVHVLIQSGIVVNELSNKYGRGGILISSNVSLSTSGYELTAGPQGRSKGGGQVGPAHPRILLAHSRIKVKHIKNKIHLQYLSIICLV